jgi:hypothetical protein
LFSKKGRGEKKEREEEKKRKEGRKKENESGQSFCSQGCMGHASSGETKVRTRLSVGLYPHSWGMFHLRGTNRGLRLDFL